MEPAFDLNKYIVREPLTLRYTYNVFDEKNNPLLYIKQAAWFQSKPVLHAHLSVANQRRVFSIRCECAKPASYAIVDELGTAIGKMEKMKRKHVLTDDERKAMKESLPLLSLPLRLKRSFEYLEWCLSDKYGAEVAQLPSRRDFKYGLIPWRKLDIYTFIANSQTFGEIRRRRIPMKTTIEVDLSSDKKDGPIDRRLAIAAAVIIDLDKRIDKDRYGNEK